MQKAFYMWDSNKNQYRFWADGWHWDQFDLIDSAELERRKQSYNCTSADS